MVTGKVDGPDGRGPNIVVYSAMTSTVYHTVQVSGVFKGEPVGKLIQVAMEYDGDCGFAAPKTRKQHVVYASPRVADAESDPLWVSACCGNELASAEVVAELTTLAGQPRKPDPSIARPTDPDQVPIIGSLLATTVVIGGVTWRRRHRQHHQHL